jgi:hypothetical protein
MCRATLYVVIHLHDVKHTEAEVSTLYIYLNFVLKTGLVPIS